MHELIAGCDEAGRGPIIGPLVICIAVIEAGKETELKNIGVKDSKLLSPSARERLYQQVKKICKEYRCIFITARQLNELMEHHSLNEIEAIKVAELLSQMKSQPKCIIVDSPDTEAKRFEQRIRKYLDKEVEIKAEHKADYNYPVVSAASIIAKVERDNEIEKIKREWGYDFGSGYPSDPRTVEFLKSNMDKEEVLKYIRKKWGTFERLTQRKLADFE